MDNKKIVKIGIIGIYLILLDLFILALILWFYSHFK